MSPRKRDGGNRAERPGEPEARKHDTVAAQLRALIAAELQPGQQLPSVRELTRTLGVSIPTLRAGQALLAQQGLLDIEQGRGVFVSTRAQRPCIGLVSELDLLHPRTGGYFRGLASALTAALRAAGMATRLYNGRYLGTGAGDEAPCPQFWDDVRAGRLAGAVLLNRRLTADWGERLQACPIPVVGAQGDYTAETDAAAIVTTAVQRLAAAGCRRVALLAWEMARALAPFRNAAAAWSLETSERWVRGDLDAHLPGAGWEEFREIWSAPGPKPDGMVICDDMLFADAQLAMLELGIRVPDQLRLVVQTNRGSGQVIRLPHTALEIDPADAATALSGMLLCRLRGEPLAPTTIRLPFSEHEVAVERPISV